jgi:hypothetical protein
MNTARQLGVLLGFCLGAHVAMAAEHPDFTGIWDTYREPGAPPPRFGGPPEKLPLKSDAQKKVDDYRALIAPSGDTPGGWCLGTGMPGSMLGSGGYPMEIVQHKDLLVVVYEAHTEVRHIYLENRAKEGDLFPDRNGYSFGHWDGDRLVVETTHLKEAVDQARYPHSDQAKIVETYHLATNADGTKVLTAEMTLTDPAFYTEPIKAVKKWQQKTGIRLLPYECNEPAWEDHLEQLREQQKPAANTPQQKPAAGKKDGG